MRCCAYIRDYFRQTVGERAEVLGPAPLPVVRMNNRYRYYGHNAAAELAARVDAVADGKQLDFGQNHPVEPKRDSK